MIHPNSQRGYSWEIRHSAIHGQGLFAVCPIESGMCVVEYNGEKIDKQESIRRCEAGNHFIFYWDELYDVDGSVDSNPARFANHSCSPNCEVRRERDRLWLFALRDIPPNEELTFNYGYDLEEYRQYACRCGSSNCTGYMVAEEYFELVRNNTGK